jgi:cell division protein FtsI/penicillin-binding protein 2
MSNVYINNRTKDFDQSLMPLKDLTYEFGSVFKPFTVYSALNNKKLDLNEYFSVDEPVYIGKKEIKDFSPSKIPLQAKDILKESSNRGAILIRRKLDCQKEYQVDLANLGLLKPVELGVGLISRSPIVNNFRGSYCDNIPFGYGLSVSPIQLLNAYGKIITGRDEFQAKILRQDTIKKNVFNLNSNQINKMLFYANDFNNELYQNFLVAGKTGTADKIIDNITVQNVAYISYFPYNDPKYLSLTFMQNPKKTYGPYMTAGNTVKPSFFNILKNIYMNLDLSILSEEVTDI